MRFGAAFAVATIAALLSWPAFAANEATATGTEAAQPQQQALSQGELDALVAPIALYPDALLAQVLMASTYPLEVVQADRFAKSNASLKGDKLDEALVKQDWDASVKSLVATPTVLDMMNKDLDWTQKLGDAVLAQQPDVMDAIQRLRAKAEANGKLATTKEQKVTVTKEADNKQVIVIEPTSPETVYVPYYEPAVVYGAWDYPDYPPYYFAPAPGWVVGGAIASGIAWGAGLAIGNAIWDDIDWHDHNINVDIDKNVNINKNVNKKDVKSGKWEHNSHHRKGVKYDKSVENKYRKDNVKSGDRKLDYRGRSGEQVLKPDGKPGDRDRPGDRGPGDGKGPGDRGDLGKGPGDGKGPARGDLGKGPGTARSLISAKVPIASPANRPLSMGRRAISASLNTRRNRRPMPSMRATAPRRATTPSVGRQASVTASRMMSRGPRAAAGRRSTEAVAAAVSVWVAEVAADAKWRRWRPQGRWRRRPRWWRTPLRHPPQARHRAAGATRQRSRTLSLPLQGQRSDRLCWCHGAGRAEN